MTKNIFNLKKYSNSKKKYCFNLFTMLKLSQVWNYDVEEDVDLDYNGDRKFSSWLKQLYEMEYKYSMVNRYFQGMPQRKENILIRIKGNLLEAAEEVVKALKNTISDWLSKHALLSPKTWADGRINQMEEVDGNITKESFEEMIGEYARWAFYKGGYNPKHNSNTYWYKMAREAQQNLNRFPSFKRLLELLMQDYKQNEMAQSNENLQDFSERYDKEFKDLNEAELFIDSLTVDDADIESLIMVDDLDNFVSIAQNNNLEKEILSEFYEYFVFPVWFSHWSEKGIEDTRENVEKVYKDLENISYEDTGNMMAIISIALNLSHQTGEMLDYLEEDTHEENLKETLTSLTNGSFIPKANKDLLELGINPEIKIKKQKTKKNISKMEKV